MLGQKYPHIRASDNLFFIYFLLLTFYFFISNFTLLLFFNVDWRKEHKLKQTATTIDGDNCEQFDGTGDNLQDFDGNRATPATSVSFSSIDLRYFRLGFVLKFDIVDFQKLNTYWLISNGYVGDMNNQLGLRSFWLLFLCGDFWSCCGVVLLCGVLCWACWFVVPVGFGGFWRGVFLLLFFGWVVFCLLAFCFFGQPFSKGSNRWGLCCLCCVSSACSQAVLYTSLVEINNEYK